MSRSYRTDPKWRIAERNAPRDENGRIVLPRIVEKAPRPGDIHPLSGQLLTRLLGRLPPELYYGLRLVEMRARQGKCGDPYAYYFPRSKTIWLYSLPPVLEFDQLSERSREIFEEFPKTVVEPRGSCWRISWETNGARAYWFFCRIFCHELGHHHHMQYPAKTGHPKRMLEEELLAEHYCDLVPLGRLSPKKYRNNTSITRMNNAGKVD
jgi:hypothetical protein